jgi:RNA polymerase sigma factor (sigma-70 family)
MISRAMTLLSDERLANLAATGSDPAFAALYNRYSGTLFAYCRSITRNADDAWDALQNAMIKVLVALRRTPDRSAPVRPWLFCICHNEAIGVLRRRSAAERVAGAATCTTVAGADEEALVREVVSEVVSDVQQLPTGQRAALVMRELADLAYGEIALALETTEGNARQLVFAARAGLRGSRAGRGLPCESVRDQLSLADGRLLRRRSVRAHLRTCDGCREYASSVRRQPVRALGAWSPLAGYQLLESVFRAAGPALVQGSSSLFAPLAAKAAAASVVLAAGIGAADVATKGESPDPATAKPVAAQSAPREPAATSSSPAPTAAGSSSLQAVPAVYSDPTRASAKTPVVRRSSPASGEQTAAIRDSRPTRESHPPPEPERESRPQREAREPRATSDEPRAARTQPDRADCPPRQASGDQHAAREPQSDSGIRRDVAFTGASSPPDQQRAGHHDSSPVDAR